MLTMLHEVAGELQKALGHDWAVRDDGHSWSARLDGPEGRAIILHADNKGQRIETYGSYQSVAQCMPYGTKAPIVTASLARPADAIAADIVRRLMPQYLELFATLAVRARAEQDYRDSVTANQQAFCEATGAVAFNKLGRDATYLSDVGKVHISSSDSVTFEYLTVDRATAIAIVELVRKANAS